MKERSPELFYDTKSKLVDPSKILNINAILCQFSITVLLRVQTRFLKSER